ncbi:MAG: hypothetical protein OXK73_12810 [Rhodospirillaceae bacterium]|nr:hypothetical protein [Rhodospirillaceae bacterium]
MVDEKRLEDAVQEPNATTCKAMKELEAGKGKSFADVDELFEDIGALRADPEPGK